MIPVTRTCQLSAAGQLFQRGKQTRQVHMTHRESNLRHTGEMHTRWQFAPTSLPPLPPPANLCQVPHSVPTQADRIQQKARATLNKK